VSLDNLTLNKQGLAQDFIDYRDYLKAEGQFSSLHIFEKVLFTLKEENLDMDELKKLPSILSLPFLEIIRYARLF
jgi:hypothetical protein